MYPTVNADGGIGSDVRVKAERPETLNVLQGLLPLDWGQEISWSRSLPFLVIAMARKAVINGVPDSDWYGARVMDGYGSLREENA